MCAKSSQPGPVTWYARWPTRGWCPAHRRDIGHRGRGGPPWLGQAGRRCSIWSRMGRTASMPLHPGGGHSWYRLPHGQVSPHPMVTATSAAFTPSVRRPTPTSAMAATSRVHSPANRRTGNRVTGSQVVEPAEHCVTARVVHAQDSRRHKDRGRSGQPATARPHGGTNISRRRPGPMPGERLRERAPNVRSPVGKARGRREPVRRRDLHAHRERGPDRQPAEDNEHQPELQPPLDQPAATVCGKAGPLDHGQLVHQVADRAQAPVICAACTAPPPLHRARGSASVTTGLNKHKTPTRPSQRDEGSPCGDHAFSSSWSPTSSGDGRLQRRSPTRRRRRRGQGAESLRQG